MVVVTGPRLSPVHGPLQTRLANEHWVRIIICGEGDRGGGSERAMK